ncbi:nicotinamidase/pyrazinamidase [Thermoflexales bacterium]|nr:nicotinamidase/pyrazinamidase [Thermoflexales bacterium]
MNTALVIVDIQNDYFPDGKLPLVGSVEASQQAARLLDHFRRAQWPIIHIQHIAVRPGATFFLPGTPGADFHVDVRPLPGEPIVQKNFPNSFRETPLLDVLREKQVNRLVICGMQTNMCIDATTRAAADYGFECLVAADACAARNLAFDGHAVPAEQVHHAFLAALNGSYAKVLKVDQLLAQLVEVPAC